MVIWQSLSPSVAVMRTTVGVGGTRVAVGVGVRVGARVGVAVLVGAGVAVAGAVAVAGMAVEPATAGV
jgi:hypothetical protein